MAVNYKYSDKNELQLTLFSNKYRVYKELDSFTQLNLTNSWSFQPNQRLSFSVGGGLGLSYANNFNGKSKSTRLMPGVVANLGMEYFLNRRLSLRASSSFLWSLGDNMDDLKFGKYSDNLWTNSFGINYFLKLKK